jgi:hypothetical protein
MSPVVERRAVEALDRLEPVERFLSIVAAIEADAR